MFEKIIAKQQGNCFFEILGIKFCECEREWIENRVKMREKNKAKKPWKSRRGGFSKAFLPLFFSLIFTLFFFRDFRLTTKVSFFFTKNF